MLKKKDVCCKPACGDSKHSRAGLEFGLAIICHSCDNACWLQVCGWPRCVYLEMNLKAAGLGRHTSHLNKNREWPLQCEAAGGSPELLHWPQWAGAQTQA